MLAIINNLVMLARYYHAVSLVVAHLQSHALDPLSFDCWTTVLLVSNVLVLYNKKNQIISYTLDRC